MGPLDLVYLELGGTTVELMCYPDATIEQGSWESGWAIARWRRGRGHGPRARASEEQGIEPSWGPVKRPSYARAEIRDPDGNSIELRSGFLPAASLIHFKGVPRQRC